MDPSVFKIREPRTIEPEALDPRRVGEGADTIAFRVEVRALAGMQKEAIVRRTDQAGRAWRMVSDEGPYLNGSDLAPFPLGFFAAGLQFCFMSELLRAARAHRVAIDSLTVVQDTWYTMTGSILRGDMTGGAKPADLLVKLESDAPEAVVARLISLAEASSPAQAVMRDVLANRFSLQLNGRELSVTGVSQSLELNVPDPIAAFTTLQPDDPEALLPDIITKVSAAEPVHGVDGGAGTSLLPEQNRTLHVRGEASLLGGTLMETVIRLFKPLGSTFRFRGEAGPDLGGADQAPPALAYLSAGVGFCYMTQLGRYAHITKQNLKDVRILQNNAYTLRGSLVDSTRTAHAHPFDTHVFLKADEPPEAATKLVQIGEQTCFLHASMRGSYPTNVRAELNGRPLRLPSPTVPIV